MYVVYGSILSDDSIDSIDIISIVNTVDKGSLIIAQLTEKYGDIIDTASDGTMLLRMESFDDHLTVEQVFVQLLIRRFPDYQQDVIDRSKE